MYICTAYVNRFNVCEALYGQENYTFNMHLHIFAFEQKTLLDYGPVQIQCLYVYQKLKHK